MTTEPDCPRWMTRTPSVRQEFLALQAGLVLTGLLHGLLVLPAFGAASGLRDRLVLSLAGNLLLGLVLFLLWLPLRRLPRRRAQPDGAARAARCFWAGLVFGLMPAVGVGVVDGLALHRNTTLGIWLAAPLFLLGRSFARRWRPTPRLTGALSLLGLLAAAAAGYLMPARLDLSPASPVLPTAPPPASAPAAAVDVVLISIDTLRADAVLAGSGIETPTLDRLRAEGLAAAFARSSGNQTLPGHAGMLSGLGAGRHRVLDNTVPFPAELPLLSEYFQGAGWRTAAYMSNYVLNRRFGTDRGWDLFDDSNSHFRDPRLATVGRTWLGWITSKEQFRWLAEHILFREGDRSRQLEWSTTQGIRTTAAGLALLDQAYRDEPPLFLFLHYMDAHRPYRAPAPWRGRHTAGLTPVEDGDEDSALARLHQHASYFEEVEFLDACLGRILAKIEAGGRPTVIVVTSDHGEFFGEHGLYGHGQHVFEPVVRVPLLFWGAGVASAELDEVHLADLAPTLLGLAGIPFDPATMDGLDLLTSGPAERDGRFHLSRDRHWAAITLPPWKWMGRWDDENSAAGLRSEQFFQLEEDLAEAGAAKQPPEDFLRLVAAWLREAAQERLLESGHLNRQDRDALVGLGYADLLEDQD
ncbi:MAG: sulfatase [Planctomycetes bacterium]|nr:sulfatase [Planctomycetota bacterium]